ncbi:MAG: hypothetical protein MUE49_00935 [Rhodospirillales bacterium]|jgi:hypothetical protein|nr:hypothetical protein [Rhodospirillales bacterium]
MTEENRLAETKRQLDHLAAALAQPGAGALSTLECRLADLQQRLLITPAQTLDEIAVRLDAIREIVAGLGEAGYLLHLVDASIRDVRALAARASPPR